jgi:hypothetical protein
VQNSSGELKGDSSRGGGEYAGVGGGGEAVGATTGWTPSMRGSMSNAVVRRAIQAIMWSWICSSSQVLQRIANATFAVGTEVAR